MHYVDIYLSFSVQGRATCPPVSNKENGNSHAALQVYIGFKVPLTNRLTYEKLLVSELT